jgi:hypothetical protein
MSSIFLFLGVFLKKYQKNQGLPMETIKNRQIPKILPLFKKFSKYSGKLRFNSPERPNERPVIRIRLACRVALPIPGIVR